MGFFLVFKNFVLNRKCYNILKLFSQVIQICFNLDNIVPPNDQLASQNICSIFNTIFPSADFPGRNKVSIGPYISDEKWYYSNFSHN